MFKTSLNSVVNFLNNKELVKKLLTPDILSDGTINNHKCFLTARAKYLFYRILEICNKPSQEFDKVRVEKIKQYGILNKENFHEIFPDNENYEKFQKEMNDILATDVEFNVNKINIDDINIDVQDLFFVNWMLSEE